ncbi:MAG: LysR family transcriptional regulator [Verrucomicrobia bacterium]|nr:LysR family transcriptional regulator [Verrucomicrobiota bacterium]
MDWLNYHHLRYFWVVAKRGSMAQASAELHVTPQTISSQIRDLEVAIGEKLFRRSGRNLVLNETGRVVFGYAQEIFALGRDLADTLKGRPVDRPPRLVVGITDAVPRLLAYRLLKPVLSLPGSARLICREGKTDHLLGELAIHEIDIVLADTPLSGHLSVSGFSHLLGDSGVTVFGASRLVTRLKAGFPGSLDGAPFLVPAENTALRRSLETWFDSLGIRPAIVGEFEDSALMKAFGQAGAGVFAVPSMMETEVKRHYRVSSIGQTEDVRACMYAISLDSRLQHPALAAVLGGVSRTIGDETPEPE